MACVWKYTVDVYSSNCSNFELLVRLLIKLNVNRGELLRQALLIYHISNPAKIFFRNTLQNMLQFMCLHYLLLFPIGETISYLQVIAIRNQNNQNC